MATKPTDNGSKEDTNDDYTVALMSNDDNENSSSIAPKAEYQRPLAEKDHADILIPQQTAWQRIFSWRTFIVALLHLSFLLNMMSTVAITVSLVCMCGPVKGPTIDALNNSGLSNMSWDTEFMPLENTTSPKVSGYEFDWDSETRGFIISGYFFTGFLSAQIGNVVRNYIGNKLTMTIFSVLFAFLSFVSPIAARTNVYVLLAVRIISGFCVNVNIPISVDTLAWWIPGKEKVTSSTVVSAGWIVGSALGSLIAGYTCKIDVDNGWPLQFYFHGILVVLWTIAWHFLSSRKPDNHPYISEQEKAYIVANRVGMSQATTKEAENTPYRTLLTSRPVLAFIARTAFHLWSMVVIGTCLPLYITSVLKFSLPEAASIHSVISIVRLPATFMWSALNNWLLGRKSMTTNKVRKICYGIAQGLATVLCLGVSFMDKDQRWAAVVLIGSSIMCLVFGMTLLSVIPLDMAPRYAGAISGLAVSVAAAVSLTAPLVATAITKQGTFEQWRVVWIIMAFGSLSAGLVFVIFGSASLQPWAVPKAASSIVQVSDLSSSDLKLNSDPLATSLLTLQI